MLKEGEIRIPSGCAIAGIMDKTGNRFSGEDIIKSIGIMRDRSNGLGGGFAGYGIYPEYKDKYAFHIFFDTIKAKTETESFLARHFEIVYYSEIPTRKIPEIKNEPLIWRYFVSPLSQKLINSHLFEEEFVAKCVIKICTHIEGAYVFSSGKNMGVFKAVGFPEEVGRFYKLEDYKGYLWTAHGRYPTNTPGWWGGAHPFSLLDLSVVHNGEISSYDANRRFIEMFGYKCTLKTDTEVITYVIDYLYRKKGLTFSEIAKVIAAPFWSEIDSMNEEDKALYTYLRKTFPSLLITGPFSILVGFNGGVMALNDRLKLRSMVVGETDNKVYIGSEECAIKVVADIKNIWAPKGGEPVIFRVKGEEYE